MLLSCECILSSRPEGVLKLPPCLQVAASVVQAPSIRQGALRKGDVFIMPGGITTLQGRAIGRVGRHNIRNFVAEGGGYVGFCAGANLALCDRYPNSLGLCPTVNLDPHYPDPIFWRGTGCVDLNVTPQGQVVSPSALRSLPCWTLSRPTPLNLHPHTSHALTTKLAVLVD